MATLQRVTAKTMKALRAFSKTDHEKAGEVSPVFGNYSWKMPSHFLLQARNGVSGRGGYNGCNTGADDDG